MHNTFQDELRKHKGDIVPTKNILHKAFIERLKKQIAPEASSSSTGGTDSSDEDVCSEELMKEIEVNFDELFANIDEDD